MAVEQPPQWHVVHQSPELRSEMDKAGVYTRGAWTCVAMREWERNAPEAFTLLPMAFHCRANRVAIAAMGRMSPDGAEVDQAPMNAEALLSKYNSPLAQSVTAGAAVAFAAACER